MESEELEGRELEVETPEAFVGLYDPPLGSLRWRIFYGGRGSAKSWQIARALLVHGMAQPLRILCGRQYQTSIRESVHKLLSDQIRRLGLGGFYDVQDRTIVARDGGGTEFIFRGIAHNADEIKSLEGVDVCWLEEMQSISDDSLEVVEPTIRKEGSEIWGSFNPGEPTDPSWQRFVVHQDQLPRALVKKVNYTDNPFATKITIEAAESLKRRDPEGYAHVYGGEPWVRSALQVFLGHYRVAEFEPDVGWLGPYFGADFGFSRDPSVLVKLYVHDSRLYIRNEARGVQLSMDRLAKRFARVRGAKRYRVMADSARPETINELRLRGFQIEAAPKWPGSVIDGIEYLRGQFEEIVIHPDCPGMIEEARLYRYAADRKTGDALPKLQKGNDHGWDATRYALSKMIQHEPTVQVWYPGMEPAE